MAIANTGGRRFELLGIRSKLVDFALEGPRKETPVGPAAGILGVEPGARNVVSAIEPPLLGTHLPNAPVFYEDTDYTLLVRAHSGSNVEVTSRLPGLLSRVVPFLGDARLSSGTMNFGRQIGRVELVIAIDGEIALRVTIGVFPSKMDIVADFQAILDDLQSMSRSLCIDYLPGAEWDAGRLRYVESDDVQWLILLRAHLPAIRQALAHVAEHPYRSLVRVAMEQRAERVRRPGPSTIRAIAKYAASIHREEGAAPRIPDRVPAVKAMETLDNAENRWLKFRLRSAARRLSRVISQLQVKREALTRSGRSTNRIASVDGQIRALRLEVERELARPLFKEVGDRVHSTIRSSLVLQSRAGYREAHDLFLVLEMGINIRGFDETVSLKDIDVLYEMWCFVSVLLLVREIAGKPLDLGRLVRLDSSGVRVGLRKGKRSAVVCRTPDLRITVSYNPIYGGPTGDQKPDIVLELKFQDAPVLFVILDAKYRIDDSREYVAQFGAIGPPIDAVNALHRYRDAITVAYEGSRGRPTVRGIALFPSADLDSWEGSKLRGALETMGIGAMPFLPRAKGAVAEWLKVLVGESLVNLSFPGPPFMAWESRPRKRD